MERCWEHRVWNNTLPIRVSHMEGTRTTALALVIRVGSADDVPGSIGAVHLLEHVLSADLSSPNHPVVGETNSITSAEYTMYFCWTVRDYACEWLRRLVRLMVAPVITPSILEAERQAVFIETARTQERPSDLLAQTLWSTVFGKHGMHGTSPNDVERQTCGSLRSLWKARYLANAAAVFAAGANDWTPLLHEVQDIDDSRSSGRNSSVPPSSSRFEPALTQRITRLESRMVSGAHFAIGILMPPQKEVDWLSGDVSAAALDALVSDILTSNGIPSNVSSDYSPYMDAGLTHATFTVPAGSTGDAIALIDSGLGRFAGHTPSSGLVERSLREVEAAVFRAGDAPNLRLSTMIQDWQEGMHPRTTSQIAAELRGAARGIDALRLSLQETGARFVILEPTRS